jgi:hypothetical protein
MSNDPRLFRAYFYTTVDANKVIRILEPLFDCYPPKFVNPVNGRNVLVIIEISEDLYPQTNFMPPIILSRLLQVVLSNNGYIFDPSPFQPFSKIGE